MSQRPKVAVVGSMNVDVFMCVQRMPILGETLAANSVQKAFGGKGANQAVACARLGGQTQMLAQVGDDDDGNNYVEFMGNEGIAVDNINHIRGVPTGQAFIISQADGENTIIINGGANMAFSSEAGEAVANTWKQSIAQSSILLLQREVPESVNIEAAKCAKESNVTVILDMGGRDDPISNELIQLCDIISPNATEVGRLLASMPSEGGSSESNQGAEEMKSAVEPCEAQITQFLQLQKPGFKLLMKQGGEGSSLLWLEGSGDEAVLCQEQVPALSFSNYEGLKLVDTTGAGDTFTAAFAVKYAHYKSLSSCGGVQTESLLDCMRFASRAAFLCISRFGATTAIPHLNEVERLTASSRT